MPDRTCNRSCGMPVACDPGRKASADAIPTGRRESPKHVTPAHQAGREAAQVQGKPTGMEDGMQTVTPGARHLEVTPIAYGTWQFGGDWESVDEQAALSAPSSARRLAPTRPTKTSRPSRPR